MAYACVENDDASLPGCETSSLSCSRARVSWIARSATSSVPAPGAYSSAVSPPLDLYSYGLGYGLYSRGLYSHDCQPACTRACVHTCVASKACAIACMRARARDERKESTKKESMSKKQVMAYVIWRMRWLL